MHQIRKTNSMKKSIAIIGGGAGALLLAAHLNSSLYSITIYEKNAAPGRKFLVAGDGGFNLTHSEELEQFISRYSPSSFIEKSMLSFTNTDLRNWLKSIGIETYIGSSKRIFPAKGIKPIDVLNAILAVLKQNKVIIETQHTWQGWTNEDELILEHNSELIHEKPDITVFALGGGSWKITGSDGSWLSYFEQKGIKTIPFMPSNCAVQINWNKEFLLKAEGKSIKNIALKSDTAERKGECVITQFGMEGGAVYALSGAIRKQLRQAEKAIVYMDLKPSFTEEEIRNKLSNRGNKSVSKLLEDNLNLNELQVALLKSMITKEEFTSLELLASKIKNLPVTIIGMAPIDEAISTIGGISLSEVDHTFQFKNLKHNYCIGEMLDWDAPTGGYLLQACFSMGYYLAQELNNQT